jgi:hypothetical protein
MAVDFYQITWCCNSEGGTVTNLLYGAEHYSRGHQLFRPLDSFPAFYGTRRFNTEFTRALQLLLSWARPIQSKSPHPTSPRSILILSTHLRFGLPSGLFLSGFPTNNLYAFLFSPPLVLHYAQQITEKSSPSIQNIVGIREVGTVRIKNFFHSVQMLTASFASAFKTDSECLEVDISL